MDISSLTSAGATNFLDPATATRATGKQVLDVNDFLKLLTVQLTSQDPMKPMEDTQFISQMASFTSLEQMRNLATEFKSFSAGQRIDSAQNYLGKIVSISSDNGITSGEVTAISVTNGEPRLMIGGTAYAPANVVSVTAKPAATAL